MGRNRLTSVEDNPHLEKAWMDYERMQGFEPHSLSLNERAILALGDELVATQTKMRSLEFQVRAHIPKGGIP